MGRRCRTLPRVTTQPRDPQTVTCDPAHEAPESPARFRRRVCAQAVANEMHVFGAVPHFGLYCDGTSGWSRGRSRSPSLQRASSCAGQQCGPAASTPTAGAGAGRVRICAAGCRPPRPPVQSLARVGPVGVARTLFPRTACTGRLEMLARLRSSKRVLKTSGRLAKEQRGSALLGRALEPGHLTATQLPLGQDHPCSRWGASLPQLCPSRSQDLAQAGFYREHLDQQGNLCPHHADVVDCLGVGCS